LANQSSITSSEQGRAGGWARTPKKGAQIGSNSNGGVLIVYAKREGGGGTVPEENAGEGRGAEYSKKQEG